MSISQIFEGVVYRITNVITGKVYIGSCVYGLRKRKNAHLFNLRNNTHHSNKLQNSFNKYGESSFIFDVIEVCSKETLLQREQYWIDEYKAYNEGYNCLPIAGNCTGRTISAETKAKISNTLKGRKVVRSEEHNKKLGIARQKPVILLNKVGEVIQEFESTKAAAKALGTSQGNISRICSTVTKPKNFNVKYKNYGL